MSFGVELFDVEAVTVLPDRPDVLSQNNHSGDIAESAFLKEVIKRGWKAFAPWGHASRADLCIWKPPSSPLTVQIKKGVWQRDNQCWKIMIGSGKPSCAANPKDYGKRYTRYGKGDFDILAMYVLEHDAFVLWALNDICGNSSITWRPTSSPEMGNWQLLEELVTA
jgi:hypothetical protein